MRTAITGKPHRASSSLIYLFPQRIHIVVIYAFIC